METISRALLTFVVNSVWQILLAAGIAALICRAMRRAPAAHRHAVWVAALAIAILLPVASVLMIPARESTELTLSPAVPASLVAGSDGVQHSSGTAAPAARAASPIPRTLAFPATAVYALAGTYLLFVLYRLLRLTWAAGRTLQMRRTAHAAAVPPLLQRVWNRSREAFGLADVELLFSTRISGPVAAGKSIILPQRLLADTSEHVLTTAIGHEMAHVARHDFACNIGYELLHLPIAFHPASWWIRSQIERTREMACDELVARRLMDARVYAESIVSIAAAMTALPRPEYTLGVFDGDVLEERIRRLMERPAANRKSALVLLAAGLSALALIAVFASGLAITARAQTDAQGFLKQTQTAFSRGDFKAAAAEAERAVGAEPDNVQAKLLLANALLKQVQGPLTREDPLVMEAHEQLADVLTRQPANRPALNGISVLLTSTKQFDEARGWALKAIQADPKNPSAYYVVGFVDWSASYPDYANARKAAGTQPQDPGIIPDPTLRQAVRAQHGARVEEGLRMLQTAIQLDPAYADAMAYMNLLYRIEAGIAETPSASAELIAKADGWIDKALEAKRNPPPPPPGNKRHPETTRTEATIRISEGVATANLIHRVDPVYPEIAKQARIEGNAVYQIVIGQDGTVSDIRAVSCHPMLCPAGMDALRQWQFKPYLLNGQSVAVTTQVTIPFRLSTGQ